MNVEENESIIVNEIHKNEIDQLELAHKPSLSIKI
jgi:hypothetical protein